MHCRNKYTLLIWSPEKKEQNLVFHTGGHIYSRSKIMQKAPTGAFCIIFDTLYPL